MAAAYGDLLANHLSIAEADYNYEHHLSDDVDMERFLGTYAVLEFSVQIDACSANL